MALKLADKHKMAAAIAISFAFFACELAGWWHDRFFLQERQISS
jgi:hypothetical protein